MRTLFALLFALPAGAGAQSWCPPGAEWVYTYSNGWTVDAVATFSYTGETVIGGITAQRIDWQFTGYLFDMFITEDRDPVFTAVNGTVVSILNENGWDTLYHFGAVPGDSWHPAPWVDMPDLAWQVTDTGTTIIDGMPLRYLAVENAWMQDTIVERLGALRSFMLPWEVAFINAPTGPLRCYSDTDISYAAWWWSYGCNSVTGVAGQRADGLSLYPNPGTTHFTLDLPPGLHTIELFDATGRRVHHRHATGPRTEVPTAHLPAGIYHVRVDGHGMAWVKE
ncbi:MAG: T9SS type A sorting domain-containing protein [Flavobacteriales bacterium]|jgi:hypothetical protein|nr:T9SS type A sorting domain-containing protein [Flavobacteriales bacterium]